MTASPEAALPGSYVWTYPGCPVRILLAFDVIDRLNRELQQTRAGEREAGGLLIAQKKSDSKTIRIVDFIPFPDAPDDSKGRFRMPADGVAEAIARCPSDSRIAGYYRTDLQQNIQLRPDDLETMSTCIRASSAVFLVIATTTPETRAGFFVREDGAADLNPSLTFPFSVDRLREQGWPNQADDAGGRKWLWDLGFQIGRMFSKANVLVRLAALSGAIALLAAALVLFWNGALIPSQAFGAPNLRLQVERDGTAFLVSWDREASAIVAAKDAGLAIWDESRPTVDGISQPLFVPLTSSQLHVGSWKYTSFSFAEQVKFQLEIESPSGKTASESVVSSAPHPASDSDRLPRVPAVAPRVSQTNVSLAAWLTHAPRLTPPRSLAARSFIPPKPGIEVNAATEVLMLEPPHMAMPGGAPNIGGWSSLQEQPETKPPDPDRQSAEGLITITSLPSGANVDINATRAGVTPLTLQVKPIGLGFTVTVTKDGFSKWSVQSFSTVRHYALHAALSPDSH